MSKKLFNILFFITIAIYFSSIVKLFSPWQNVFDIPLFKYDYAFHYSNVINAEHYLRTLGDCWGYNPSLSAGIIETQGISNRILIPIKWLFSFIPFHITFNLSIFAILLSLPFLLALACKNITSNNDSAKQYFISTSLFLSFSIIGNQFIVIGHFGFLLSCVLAILASSFINKYFQTGKIRCIYLQATITAFALWSHVLTIFILVPLLITSIWQYRKEIHKNEVKHFVISTMFITLLPNLLWLPSFIEHVLFFHHYSSSSSYLQTSLSNIYHYIVDPIIIMIMTLSLLNILWFKKNQTNIAFFATISFLLPLCTIGSIIGLGDSQPIRFIIPLFLIFSFYAIIKNNYKHILINTVIILSASTVSYLISYSNYFKLGVGFSDIKGEKLFSFMNDNISRKSRVHIQSSKLVPYYNTRIVPLLPTLLNIQILANSLPFPEVFEQFSEDAIFNKKLYNISKEEFKSYLTLYNIGYFIIHNEDAQNFLTRMSNSTEIFNDGISTIFKINNHEESYCYKCSAQVDIIDYNLNVSNIEGNEIILKYHYLKRFRPDHPSIKLSPVYLLDDPTPFIKINLPKGVNQLTITTKHDPPFTLW